MDFMGKIFSQKMFSDRGEHTEEHIADDEITEAAGDGRLERAARQDRRRERQLPSNNDYIFSFKSRIHKLNAWIAQDLDLLTDWL